MGWIVESIIASIPWWAWAAVALVVLAALHRFVGWKGIIGGALAFAGLFAFKRGQSVGEGRIKQKNKENIDALEQHYKDIEAGNRPDLDRDIERLRNIRD